MSVFIEDFCKEEESELAKKLAELVDWFVLIGEDSVNITNNKSCISCHVIVTHTISCNDIEVMQRVLAGLYWRFSTAPGSHGYELCIDFNSDDIG